MEKQTFELTSSISSWRFGHYFYQIIIIIYTKQIQQKLCRGNNKKEEKLLCDGQVKNEEDPIWWSFHHMDPRGRTHLQPFNTNHTEKTQIKCYILIRIKDLRVDGEIVKRMVVMANKSFSIALKCVCITNDEQTKKEKKQVLFSKRKRER